VQAASSIRVMVVEDYQPFRQLVCSKLEEQPELQVICEVTDGLEAVQKAEALKPDLILLDIGLPHLNGIQAEHQICKLVPSAKVLFLSQNNDREIANAVIGDRTLGYVLKADAGSELLPAIEAIISGEGFISSGIEESIS
jgi:DNA-binding NarL/FixJ family response regulator